MRLTFIHLRFPAFNALSENKLIQALSHKSELREGTYDIDLSNNKNAFSLKNVNLDNVLTANGR